MKYYRCVRDLFHYRYNGNIYNFRMGQIVPYTPMVQNNLLNFEPFGSDFKVEKAEKEELLIEEPKPIREVKKTIKTKPKPKKVVKEPTVEVEIEVKEVQPVKKKRGRPKKKKEVEDGIKV